MEHNTLEMFERMPVQDSKQDSKFWPNFHFLAILLAIVIQIGSSIYSFSSLETKVSYIHDELITMKKNDERFDRRLYAAEQEIALLKYIIDHNKEKK